MSTPSKEPTVQELFDLSGKVALITGAGGYLGSAMSRALAEAGATVVAGSRSRERAEAVVAELPSPHGATHHAAVIDYLDEGVLRRGFDDVVEWAGRIDVLVNNGHQAEPHDWSDVTPEGFNRQLENATGYFLLSRMVRDLTVAEGTSASVIMLGSMYGLVASYPDAYEGVCAASPVAYHALKGGIIHMTRHLAVYWARDGLRVNCLSPGPFPNPQKVPAGLVERLQPHCPLGRMGANHELKGAVVFLASDASRYMTGQNLIIDGGWTAW